MVGVSDLEEALLACFGKDTCYPNDRLRWSPENPATGHCAVTALLVQDFYRGTILRCEVRLPDGALSPHYYNKLKDGSILDFTRRQFPEGSVVPEGQEKIPPGYRSARQYIVSTQDTLNRYQLLRSRVLAYLKTKNGLADEIP